MALRVVENRSLADEVFAQLLGELVGGGYAPGETLPAERTLSSAFGVNRHVVREALGRLEQLGLVTIVQGGGTRVLDVRRSAGLDLLAVLAEHARSLDAPPLAPLRAALEMRAGIGADVVRLCARRAGPELHTRLRGLCEAMADASGHELVALDERFWQELLEGADNLAYQLAFNSLIRGVHAMPELSVPWLQHELRSGDFRRPIAEAVAAGDPDAAARVTREALEPAVAAFDAIAAGASGGAGASRQRGAQESRA